jgi:hypothetical protein
MTTPLRSATDDQLDALFGRWLAIEAEGMANRATGATTMVQRVSARLAGRRRSRFVLLAAAALLVAAAIVGAAIGGSILLRRLQPPTSFGNVVPCSASAENRLMWWRRDEPNGWTETSVEPDGRLLIEVTIVDGQSPPITVRRLSPAGIERITAEVLGAGVPDGCRTVYSASTGRSISLAGAGHTIEVAWGPSAGGRRPPNPDDEALVNRLGDRLDNLDAWLPADAWIDPVERPYVADRWIVIVQQRVHQRTEPVGRDPDGVVLPDGSTVTAFGQSAPGTPPGPPTAVDQTRDRCAEVSDAEANSMLALFKRVGAVSVSEEGHAWLFTVRAAVPYDVVFFLNPVRPDWSSCFAGLADESPAASTLSGLGDPCKDLPTPAAQAIMGNGLMRADTQLAERAGGGRGLIDGASCGYSVHQDAPIFDAVTIAIYARDDVGDAEAGALAVSMLGDETPEAIRGGWSLYANGCTGPAAVCPPSVILARAPLLYLIDTPTRFRDDDARRIAAAIATSVDARPSAAPGPD